MPLSRRHFLSGAATGMVAPAAHANWLFGGDTKSNAEGNLYALLDLFHFLGQDGVEINKNALKASLKGNAVILSFFYKGCGATDPEILTQQAKIAAAAQPAKLIHLVIDTNPFTDTLPPPEGNNPRDAFLQDMTQPASHPRLRYPEGTQYLPVQNTRALYPLDVQGRPFSSQQDALQGVKDIQDKLGAQKAGGFVVQTIRNTEPTHFPTMVLYTPDGAPVLAGLAKNIDVSEWAAAVKSMRQGINR